MMLTDSLSKLINTHTKERIVQIQAHSLTQPRTLRSQQSPIDLREPVYAPGLSDQVDIGWSRSSEVPAQTTPGSHAILMPGQQAPLTINGKDFEPKGIHFHGPSEHLVNGKPYPVEMHIVHQNDEDGTRAVVGIFLDDQGVSGSPADTAVKNLLDRVEHGGGNISPSDILPEDSRHFYRYEGSLTTPGYDENVSWMVLKEPIHLSPETLSRLKDEQGHEAREAQDLNRRFVLANFQN